MMMPSQVLKIQGDKLSTCMTCPLCNKLFREATTISECLHTFCRKCIYEKIRDEELNHCPVCNIDLGCAPMEKLRVDHNIQDLRAKLFSCGRKNARVGEATSSVPLPGKRKERSLSSLGVSAPRLRAHSGMIGRRKKYATRKSLSLQEPTLFVDELFNRKDDEKVEGCMDTSKAESSKQHTRNKLTKDHTGQYEGKNNLWKPLSGAMETARKSKSSKFNMQVTRTLPDPNEVHVPKAKTRGPGNKSKGQGGESTSAPALSGSAKRRKLQGVQQTTGACSVGLSIPGQAILDANSKRDRRFSSIWFALVAFDDQVGDAPLPQITSRYLRVKDGSLPVSVIKKYLVKKLNLASEAEVSILLGGQPVISTQKLHELVELWLQTKPASERIPTSVGSSAKDFVMVLSYGRSAYPP